MKQWALLGVTGIIVIFAGFQIFRLYKEEIELKNRLTELNKTVAELNAENAKLSTDVDYFGNQANLVKELKSKFNYVQDGEKLMIIVPSTTASGTASSSTQ